MRRGIWVGASAGACVALLLASTAAASGKVKRQISVETVKQVIESKTASVQLVTFPETRWNSVKVLRGPGDRPLGTGTEASEKTETAEIVTFAGPQASTVRVLRGESGHPPVIPGRPQSGMTTQLVSFANFRDRPINVLRGSVPQAAITELFGPASPADLDRIAFAVDGAESSHGADLRMWQPEPSGPQGPMQVTAAAASDVGGGDRFDLAQNRVLGRAYLERLYLRYGNWSDAVVAYNWGPGNLDAWISGGRPAEQFPLHVQRYRDRVLRDAALVHR
jgi:gas vesicle protein